jgi:ABC-type multidrug transport system ATPase subunit
MSAVRAATFVNVLMGKIKNTGGAIYVNGAKKNITEYVTRQGDIFKFLKRIRLGIKRSLATSPQDDIVLPELTVRENILHSARIRMPSDWTDHEIQEHVDKLIACLQLSHVQHSRVGDPVRPTISGGQRKRVNIGIELAATPVVLILDEPTSGLDSSSALSVMKLLHTLSLLGVTVVPVIHQPRTEIFETLGSVMLLAEGQLVYQGKTSGARPYFRKAGLYISTHLQPGGYHDGYHFWPGSSAQKFSP